MALSDDLKNMYEALRLEIDAVARYEDHQSATEDPAVFALLQGLMRNEVGHEEHLVEHIKRLGGDPKEADKLPGPSLPNMVYEGEQIAGQKTNLAMLRADMAFEAEATRIYHEFASQATDDQVKAMFVEFARAEKGHVNGLRFMLKEFEDRTHDVVFYCPVCGWGVSFGTDAQVGAESRCRMCGVLFALREQDGDFALERR